MKTMTCKQLGGACDLEFRGNTFEQMANQSKIHGMEMYQAGDAAHIKAMSEIMQMPNLDEWFENKSKEFDALPDDEEKDLS